MQTDVNATEPVRQSVVVRCPLAETFALFTDGLDSWWPLHTHSIAADTFESRVSVESITLEKRVGGRVLERMSDGTEAPWGTILVWEPPTRFVMSWKPTMIDDAAHVAGYSDGWRELLDLFQEVATKGV